MDSTPNNPCNPRTMTISLLALAVAATVALPQAHAAELPAGGATNAASAADIKSDAELQSVVLQLQDPATEMPALRRLVKFSGEVLYEASVIFLTGDQAVDERRHAAARAVRSHANPDTVRRALDDGDQDVRFWGVMSFGFTFGETKPWEPLLPRLEALAAHDVDPESAGRLSRDSTTTNLPRRS